MNADKRRYVYPAREKEKDIKINWPQMDADSLSKKWDS
jgi:hypothetical protein